MTETDLKTGGGRGGGQIMTLFAMNGPANGLAG